MSDLGLALSWWWGRFVVVLDMACFSGAQPLRHDNFLSQLDHQNPSSEVFVSELGNIITRGIGVSLC